MFRFKRYTGHLVTDAISSFEIQQHLSCHGHTQAMQHQPAGAPSLQERTGKNSILVVILFSSSSSPKENAAKCHCQPVDKSDLQENASLAIE